MSNKKETVEQIYKLLMALVDDEEGQTIEEEKPKKKSTRKTTPVKNKRVANSKKTKTVSTNKFDSMPERNMFKEDTAIDKKLRVLDPCPRTRSFNTIEVACRVCGKKENLNPVLVNEPTRYKCNGCSRSGG